MKFPKHPLDGPWTPERMAALHKRLWRTRHERWGPEGKKKELNGYHLLKPLKGNVKKK